MWTLRRVAGGMDAMRPGRVGATLVPQTLEATGTPTRRRSAAAAAPSLTPWHGSNRAARFRRYVCCNSRLPRPTSAPPLGTAAERQPSPLPLRVALRRSPYIPSTPLIVSSPPLNLASSALRLRGAVVTPLPL